MTQFPHGNSKWKAKLTTPYVRTNPDLFDEIRKKNGAPSTIFRKLLTEGPKDLIRHLVDAPRDIEQVSNIKKNQRRSDRFCHDAFYNIIDLKAEVKEFITYYRLFPNVVVFGCNDALLTKLRAILGRKDLPNQMLTVDTTFKLGDFYCTVLIFVETEFEEKPLIPVIYMLHERKLQDCHDVFFREVAKLIPELKNPEKIFFVTDDETAIVNALKEHFPNVDAYRCWNHVISDCRRKLALINIGKRKQQQKYIDDIYTLIRASSKEEYMELLLSMSVTWDKVSNLIKIELVHQHDHVKQ